MSSKKKVDSSNSKTSVKELTKEECAEVEKHIKEVFYDVVTNKYNDVYDGRSNEVIKDKQMECQVIQKQNAIFTNTLERKTINDYRNVYEPYSINDKRSSYSLFSMNNQRSSYKSINDQHCDFSMNYNDNSLKVHSLYSQRDSFYMTSMDSSYFSQGHSNTLSPD